ncbi:Sorting nexin mvp1 [Apophysomyces ossiformis]|uniref:Sorting nexin MVP1 n=1 Tax=Apophysomyces ossiformis TaxID=679940 RepID=A0A8H7BUT3_9FUNG|nr:Sorting nexin mvp1 [Apophysomyces ossiformis]
MLHQEEDPLSTSFFDITNSQSLLGAGSRSLATSFSHYEDSDPWGSMGRLESMTDISRTFTTPSFHSSPASTPLDTTEHLNPANALTGVRLPETYSNYFSQLQRSGRVSLSSLHKLLEKSGQSPKEIEKILSIVVPNGASYVTRPEFNTALALLACAQNQIEVSLNNLHRHKHSLPELTPIISQPEKRDSDKHTAPTVVSPLDITSKHTANGNETSYPGMAKPVDAKPKMDSRSWFQDLEEIKVTIAPERAGFIFKHVNYIVESQKRSSIVLRRYSDFWWLMEVLLRRYPFRTLPNLPPKKVGGRDAAFLEKRRKGLSRFINAIVRHPILHQDEVVIKFLTEPSEMVAWRKQNPPSLDEEYRRIPQSVEEMINSTPENVDELLQKAKNRVKAMAEHYNNFCFIMERMIRRMHGQATDFTRYSIALNCQQVVKGYENVAKRMQKESSILESQVNATADGVLENLKRFRDLLMSFKELETRKDKLAVNQTESLSKRIASNRSKMNQLKGVPGSETEVARLEEAILSDEHELQDQRDHQVFIQFCMWSELTYLHKQQAFVSSLYRDWVQDMIKFSQQRAENWAQLEGPVSVMPTEYHLFD